MANVSLPAVRPKGDDQQWKQEVVRCLREIIAELKAINTQLGGR